MTATLNPSRRPACAGEDPDLFFGEWGEDPDAREVRVAKAQAICAACPVRPECAEFAATRRITWGVWGGEDREHASPPVPEGPPVLCSKSLHLMTPENSKPIAGTMQVRCRQCQLDSDRRTRAARHARLRQRRREQQEQERVA